MTATLKFAIDVFAVFGGRLIVGGWTLDREPIADLRLISPGFRNGWEILRSYGRIPSPDVAAHHGSSGAQCRFSEAFDFDPSNENLIRTSLQVTYGSGRSVCVDNLVGRQSDPAGEMHHHFQVTLEQMPPGHLIEIGSRARSGITRRHMVPNGWNYTGLDIMAGPNVAVVGDAHELSSLFPEKSFHAVMAFSVLEHILMPWKFVVELNKVLADGAVGIFTTHQAWPVHDEPWDFWRYSNRAWDGLLNKHTGFEIIAAVMGEPAYTVAQRCHPVTNFGLQPSFLASNIMFRKIADTRLEWPVPVKDVVATHYPEGNIA